MNKNYCFKFNSIKFEIVKILKKAFQLKTIS